MKSNKSKTPQRIAVFIGLKLLELLIIPVIVFVPYYLGKFLCSLGECGENSNWFIGGITIFVGLIAVAMILFSLWVVWQLIKEWITYNWQKAGKIVGVKEWK